MDTALDFDAGWIVEAPELCRTPFRLTSSLGHSAGCDEFHLALSQRLGGEFWNRYGHLRNGLLFPLDRRCVFALAFPGDIDQDFLAQAFARRFVGDPHREYTGGAAYLLGRIADGEDWREVSPSLCRTGSYGNGAAMRAAPHRDGVSAGCADLSAGEDDGVPNSTGNEYPSGAVVRRRCRTWNGLQDLGAGDGYLLSLDRSVSPGRLRGRAMAHGGRSGGHGHDVCHRGWDRGIVGAGNPRILPGETRAAPIAGAPGGTRIHNLLIRG
jgi:hypothetical protein